MPDVFSGGGVNRVFRNISSVIADALEAPANENQVQITSQLLRILGHALD
jgi:hypothetical protein